MANYFNIPNIPDFRDYAFTKGQVIEPGEENQYRDLFDEYVKAKGAKVPQVLPSTESKQNFDVRSSSQVGGDTGQEGSTGGTFKPEDLDQFQQLLNRLTSSKMTQQAQKSKEGRKDIYAGGLSSMMRNF